MSFRRALCAFALFIGAPATALAEGARQVELGYEITFAGITGFRLDFTTRLDGTTYDAESHIFKEGLLRSLTIHYEGRNRAWGSFASQDTHPVGGSLSLVVTDKTRTWLAQYGAGGAMQETHNPEWKPPPQHAISEEQRRGSLDPLSAGLSVAFAGDAACNRTAHTNDGKRRIDVLIRRIGTESPAQAGVPGAQGDVLVCEVSTKRIAGEFYDAPTEAESERERPMKLWFARLDRSSIRYPAKLEAQSSLGTIHGRLLWFRERPLTEEERIAMRR